MYDSRPYSRAPVLPPGHRIYDVTYHGQPLTIQKNGIGSSDARLRATLDRFFDGAASAEQVAIEYVNARIVGRPSELDAITSNLDELVALVAEHSAAPRIHAQCVAELPVDLLKRLPIPTSEPLSRSTDGHEPHRGRIRSILKHRPRR